MSRGEGSVYCFLRILTEYHIINTIVICFSSFLKECELRIPNVLHAGAFWPAQTAVFLGPVTCLPTILFSGFFVSLSTIPRFLQWLTYLSYMRFSMEGILSAIYGFHRGELDCPTSAAAAAGGMSGSGTGGMSYGGMSGSGTGASSGAMSALSCPTPAQLLEQMGVSFSYTIDLLVLIGDFFLIRTLCYFALRYRLSAAR